MSNLNIPPFSEEAEQAVLGAIMLSETKSKEIVEVMNDLKTSMFYYRGHRHIYDAIRSLTTIDFITVSDWLEKKDLLEDSGGFKYLADLVKNVMSKANIKAYAEIIKERAAARQIIGICTEATHLSYNGGNPTEIRRKIYDELEGVMQSHGEVVIAEGEQLCNDLVDELERISKQGGGLTGMSTGDKHIDEATGGLQPGDYVGLAARSGGGKTTKALNILGHYAMKGRRCLFFSMEMKRSRAMMKIVSDLANVPFAALKNANLDDYNWSRIGDTFDSLKKSKLMIDDSSGLSIDDVERKARAVKQKHGELDLIVLDYIQRLKIDSGKMYSELTSASNRLKDLFMELGCSGIVLAQLKKNSIGTPNASDLRETGAIENDSDLLIFLHTPSEDLKPHKGMLTWEIFNKVRYGETGVKMLTNELDFQRFTCSDEEWSEPDENYV